MDKPIYGIWNVLGKCWIITDSGSQFKTTDLDVALDVFNKLTFNGSTQGVEIRGLSLEDIETFEPKL